MRYAGFVTRALIVGALVGVCSISRASQGPGEKSCPSGGKGLPVAGLSSGQANAIETASEGQQMRLLTNDEMQLATARGNGYVCGTPYDCGIVCWDETGTGTNEEHQFSSWRNTTICYWLCAAGQPSDQCQNNMTVWTCRRAYYASTGCRNLICSECFTMGACAGVAVSGPCPSGYPCP